MFVSKPQSIRTLRLYISYSFMPYTSYKKQKNQLLPLSYTCAYTINQAVFYNLSTECPVLSCVSRPTAAACSHHRDKQTTRHISQSTIHNPIPAFASATLSVYSERVVVTPEGSVSRLDLTPALDSSHWSFTLPLSPGTGYC